MLSSSPLFLVSSYLHMPYLPLRPLLWLRKYASRPWITTTARPVRLTTIVITTSTPYSGTLSTFDAGQSVSGPLSWMRDSLRFGSMRRRCAAHEVGIERDHMCCRRIWRFMLYYERVRNKGEPPVPVWSPIPRQRLTTTTMTTTTTTTTRERSVTMVRNGRTVRQTWARQYSRERSESSSIK